MPHYRTSTEQNFAELGRSYRSVVQSRSNFLDNYETSARSDYRYMDDDCTSSQDRSPTFSVPEDISLRTLPKKTMRQSAPTNTSQRDETRRNIMLAPTSREDFYASEPNIDDRITRSSYSSPVDNEPSVMSLDYSAPTRSRQVAQITQRMDFRLTEDDCIFWNASHISQAFHSKTGAGEADRRSASTNATPTTVRPVEYYHGVSEPSRNDRTMRPPLTEAARAHVQLQPQVQFKPANSSFSQQQLQRQAATVFHSQSHLQAQPQIQHRTQVLPRQQPQSTSQSQRTTSSQRYAYDPRDHYVDPGPRDTAAGLSGFQAPGRQQQQQRQQEKEMLSQQGSYAAKKQAQVSRSTTANIENQRGSTRQHTTPTGRPANYYFASELCNDSTTRRQFRSLLNYEENATSPGYSPPPRSRQEARTPKRLGPGYTYNNIFQNTPVTSSALKSGPSKARLGEAMPRPTSDVYSNGHEPLGPIYHDSRRPYMSSTRDITPPKAKATRRNGPRLSIPDSDWDNGLNIGLVLPDLNTMAKINSQAYHTPDDPIQHYASMINRRSSGRLARGLNDSVLVDDGEAEEMFKRDGKDEDKGFGKDLALPSASGKVTKQGYTKLNLSNTQFYVMNDDQNPL